MRLGVLGGTFDPIHIGHLVAAQCAVEQLELERVLFVPTGESWQKAITSPADVRRSMVQLAIEGNYRFELSTVDIDRTGHTYTVDTLSDLKSQYPASELYFILGVDAFQGIRTWNQNEKLGALATMAVLARGTERPDLDLFDDIKAIEVQMPTIDISSTLLRRRAFEGQSLKYLVPDTVDEFIHANGLYREAR